MSPSLSASGPAPSARGDHALPRAIAAQAKLLKRGTIGIVPDNGLTDKLSRAARENRPLRIKLGLDPTAPDIHLGFAVVLRKLRQFQDLGHTVIVIIGDYTALIGDPSGRSATRPMLTPEQITANGATYVDQLTRILARDRTVVRFNSEWLGKLEFADIVELAAKMTVAQVLQRDDFAERYAGHVPIGLHELLYPLAQAYDSVAIESDIEMGGQDQTFNILAGRDLQRQMGQEPQVALFMPLLVGLDGVKKMSKSLGNYVGITEPPDTMFAKIMSIPDAVLAEYFELCTDMQPREISAVLAQTRSGELNPRDTKRRLAREIITLYYALADADRADEEWMRVHSAGENPSDMPHAALAVRRAGGATLLGYDDATRTLTFGEPARPVVVQDGKVWLCGLLAALELAKGTSDARRLIGQGGVLLGGRKLTPADEEVPLRDLVDTVIRVGPKRYVRVTVDSA